MKTIMKPSTKNRTEGAAHQLKGAIKESAGTISDNPKLKAKGIVENISGKIQEKIGHVQKVFGK